MRIFRFPQLDSTVSKAKEFLGSVPLPFAVIADEQSQGRGRFERLWVSPPGGLYISLVRSVDIAAAQMGIIPLSIGVSLRETIEKMTGIRAQMKWPNDLLVENKKISGILVQTQNALDQEQVFIMSVGVNVNTSQKNIPDGATSLFIIQKEMIDLVSFCDELLQEIERDLRQCEQGKGDRILKKWKQHSETIGRNVTITQDDKVIRGQALDLTSQGALLIKTPDGKRIKVFSGTLR